ncbi:MAG: hypothetical protein KatS3mg119_1569 [Rhodothalassiaceae bacterium]|nr:MAG: hypothetical protein KatS3mg119_1569 [Rhodothalassiaceae bacterium]
MDTPVEPAGDEGGAHGRCRLPRRVVRRLDRRTHEAAVTIPALAVGPAARWIRRSSRRMTRRGLDPPVEPAGDEGERTGGAAFPDASFAGLTGEPMRRR